MPLIYREDGNIEIRYREDNQLVMMIPQTLMKDLCSVALIDGIEQANNEIWLLGEIRRAGEPRGIDPEAEHPVCWNCGGTAGFYAPTGDKRPEIRHYRADTKHGPSPIHREFVFYECPACQNPTAKLIEKLQRAGIPDPEDVLARSNDIWWNKPGREAMEAGIQRLVDVVHQHQIGGFATLVGPYGCGKTILAEYFILECIRGRHDALYVTADAFKAAVYDAFDPDSRGAAFLQRVRSAPILVFDQIDWIRETTSGGQQAYAAEVFRDIFDHRYALRRTHTTVMVCNLKAWEDHEESVLSAIYDRMNEGLVLVAQVKNTRKEIADLQIYRGDEPEAE